MTNPTNQINLYHVRFLFDPACPWAFRAATWIQEVAEVIPLIITWEVFSLAYINRDQINTPYMAKLKRNQQALRLLAKSKEIKGEAGIGALYMEFGQAVHAHKKSLSDEAVLARALTKVGLSISLLAETRDDEALDQKLETSYANAIESGAFGVPTMYINTEEPFYGPLIDSIPTGYEAIKLWEHVSALISLPYFFELKRNR